MEASVTVNSTQALDLPNLCRPIADSSPMPTVAVLGAGHMVRYANPAFCALVGKTMDELIGHAFSSATPSGEECLSLLDRVYQTGRAEIHTGRQDPASHLLDCCYVMWPVLAADGGRMGILIQVTEPAPFLVQSTGINEALMISSVRQHELTEQAERLNEELRQANDDLKQFAFAASHDLQEPLRMITSYSQLLIKGYRGELDGEAALCVDFISQGATQMRELLANLLSYTRLGAEKAADEPIDLNTVLERVKQNLKGAIDETAAVVTSGDLPTVQGQDGRFVQLFQNLMSNAIKYRGASPPRIHVSAEQRDTEWRFAVADNGMGIESKYYQTIFGVFKRLHGNAIPGTGIGLAICQRVVERYGGRIWVESRIGLGTTFYFTLPVSGGANK